jgi:hypothetical protein
MTTITKTYELPPGLHQTWIVKDQAEAIKIANGRTCYFYTSTVIVASYLFIPVEPK